MLNDDELMSVKDTVTKSMMSTNSRSEAIDACLKCSQSAMQLLRRKKIRRDILMQYLARKSIPVVAGTDKHNSFNMDLRRTIIILMALACVINVIGVIHCHLNYPYNSTLSAYRISYSIIFPILLALTGFLLIEQLIITDGTVAPLNRFRTIYAFVAAIVLFSFGIGASVLASRWYDSSPQDAYHHSAVIASVVAFVGMTVYFAEALARHRKSRII
ncbi:unnamed protein product [Rotaria sordida]|uniref:Uncharacterized protein n=1 Tax=Rotaria sordida TaxID=392033 RepID=A0A814B941_9BILA|nr:unnamed protein product [Rotaria sordida]CAF0923804.1 unnamed protein product [Rotaria sordida]